MAGPWEKYGTAGGASDGPWTKYASGPSDSEGQDPKVSGSFLPLSKNLRTGEIGFDSDAGALGQLKRAVMLPGEAMRGETQLRDINGNFTDEAIGRTFDAAGIGAPGAIGTRTAAKALPERPFQPQTETQALTEAGQRLGVDLPRAVTSTNPVVQQAGQVLSNIPVAGTPIREASKRAIGQMDTAAQGIQDTLGSGSVPLAGTQARAGIGQHITQSIGDRIENEYVKLGNLIDPEFTRPLTETAKRAASILGKREGAARRGESKAVAEVAGALERPEGLTYDGLRNLRTSVREMLDNPSALPAETSQSELKQIYGGLTEDLRSVVRDAGNPQALKQFEKANSFTARKSRDREALNELIKPKADEAVFDRIVAMANSKARANIRDLSRARGAVSQDTWDEIGSAVLSRLGRSDAGDFTPDRFLTAYGKLAPEGKKILFGTTNKNTLNALDDLARVSTKFKELREFQNPSGTGQTVTGAGSALAALYNPLRVITSIAGGRVLSGFLARPGPAKRVSAWARAYDRALRAPSRAAFGNLKRRSQALAVPLSVESGESVESIVDGLTGANIDPVESVPADFDPRVDA